MADFLLNCMPIIREYTSEIVEDVAPAQVLHFKVASRKGVRRQDIYKRYMTEVEGECEGEIGRAHV